MGLFKYAITNNPDDWFEDDTDDDVAEAETKVCVCENCGKSFVLGDVMDSFRFCDLGYDSICTLQLLCEDCAYEEAEIEYPEREDFDI